MQTERMLRKSTQEVDEKMRDRNRQDHVSLAMAYVAWQNWEELFEPAEALERGTAFPSLDMPFCWKGAMTR